MFVLQSSLFLNSPLPKKTMAASRSDERSMSVAHGSDSSAVEKLNRLLNDNAIDLSIPCDSVEKLLKKLDKLEQILFYITRDDKKLVEMALQRSKEALIAKELIKHAEVDVRVSVASCISEIVRITAPYEPYDPDHMKEFFQVAYCGLEKLACMDGRAYSRAITIVELMSCTQSCVKMLDLELYNIVINMFHLFLDSIRYNHPSIVFSSMENIMTLIFNNGDDHEFQLELIKILLSRLKKENHNVSPISFKLAENTLRNCADILKTYLPEAISRLGIPIEEYAEIVASLCQDATQRENVEVASAENSSANIISPEDLTAADILIDLSNAIIISPEVLTAADILINTLASASEPISPKQEAISRKFSNPQSRRKKTTSKKEASKVRNVSKCHGDELVGQKIKVWWPLEKTFFEGKVTSFDPSKKTHLIDYDDGDREELDLTKERWQLLGDNNPSSHKRKKTATAPSASSKRRK